MATSPFECTAATACSISSAGHVWYNVSLSVCFEPNTLHAGMYINYVPQTLVTRLCFVFQLHSFSFTVYHSCISVQSSGKAENEQILHLHWWYLPKTDLQLQVKTKQTSTTRSRSSRTYSSCLKHHTWQAQV